MAKKKFTEGLESLFSGFDEETKLEPQSVPGDKPKTPAKVQETHKRQTGKHFSEDLESFLQEAFQESFDRQWQGGSIATASDTATKKRSHRPMSGLDALIRATVEPRIHPDDLPTRRLTIVLDESKILKLKEIAKIEKALLRDIIDNIVERFIQEYQQKHKES